jgi:4'-phosphopantetheinyl transferase
MYWLEQTQKDLPAADDWLNSNERLRLRAMRFPKRRDDWRLGRWTAKRAAATWLNLPHGPEVLANIEIRAAASGAPEVLVANQPAPFALSLSHRSGVALCALAEPEAEVGCDLEAIEDRDAAFLADYFTAGEQALVAAAPAADRARTLTLLWSGKESVLKGLRTGLRLDTRFVVVRPAAATYDDTWSHLQAWYAGRLFQGWWREAGGLVRTLVAARDSAEPCELRLSPRALA